MNKKQPKVLMIDALVGNDYAFHLCKALDNAGINISLVVTKDRKETSDYNYPVIPLSPPKAKTEGKISKTIKYFYYLFKLFRLIKREKFNIVHFQFFRRTFKTSFWVPIRVIRSHKK